MINYSLYESSQSKGNVVLIHGLFGDKDNLNNLRRSLQQHYSVMAIDLPDHGHSEWTQQWQFDDVVHSLHSTLKDNTFSPCSLIGHSLGGKVAMAYSLLHPNHTASVIAADIAPVEYTPRHDNVFKALNAVDLYSLKDRKQALDVLNTHLTEPGTAQFLLKSLKNSQGQWQWQFNLKGLERDYSSLSQWPFDVEKFNGPVTLIKGERSNYILQSHSNAIKKHFPNAMFKMISGTGHWLHAEKPTLFNNLVLRILYNSLNKS